MATVYLCTDSKFDRQVAIKLLHPELGAAVGADRFHREIKIATGLSHPSILPAFDSGQAPDGRLFYVMPFVDGESLRTRLQRERQLSVEDAIRITAQIASGLQYAHTRNIIHRDVKPENILLQGTETVIADFGIARAVSGAASADSITQTGMTIGTPQYMSPEQATGDRAIDGRADQYSLACVTYEMLAGQPPFVAPSLQALAMKHINEAAPLISTIRPSIPDELEDVILRALAKVAADRWPTVEQYAEALTKVAMTSGTWARRTGARTGAVPHTRRYRASGASLPQPKYIFAAGALAGLMLVGLVAWKFGGRTETLHDKADRLAVLYFQTPAGDTSARALADGFTESLIERLSEVPALNVASRNGVLRFRGAEVSPDSVGRTLGVGSIVEGSVVPTSRGARVTVSLTTADNALLGRTAADYDSTRASLAAFTDSLVERVALFLQGRVGAEVALRESRRGTSSTDAWMLVQRAEVRNKEADSLMLAGAIEEPQRVLGAADSLLMLAESADNQWSRPVTLRASTQYLRAKATRDPLRVGAMIDSGVALADRAIALNPRDADALELRGRLLFLKVSRQVVTETKAMDRAVAEAEQALTQAVSVNKNQAGAWDELSALHYRKLDLQEVIRSAEKAYEADAWLRSSRDILKRLFYAMYNLEYFPEAMKKLAEFQRRFPADPFGPEARLFMYRAKGQVVDVDSAWIYMDEFVKRSPEPRRPFNRKRGEMLVAGGIARKAVDSRDSRLADSARSVLLRARTTDPTIDPSRDLMANEASVRVILGDHDEAVRLLNGYVTVNPHHRRGFANATGWMWRDLQSHPKFKALISGL
jgi:TolB-like protein